MERSSGKTFKSCRRCRKQKMRCDARQQIPCSRCKAAEATCTFDRIEDKKRYNRDEDQVENNKRSKYLHLEFEVQKLRSEIHYLRTERTGLINGRHDLEHSQDHGPARKSATVEQENLPLAEGQVNELQDINTLDTNAPLTAVHIMANTSKPQVLMHSKRDPFCVDDVVSRGVLCEERARAIFDMFMTGSRNFTPLFDPVLDSFDSLRLRSTFCFTVVIWLAVRASVESCNDTQLVQICQDEVKKLTYETLFKNPPNLETIQGMILLAAYSEKSFFALGHALQMAKELGISKTLATLHHKPSRQHDSTTKPNCDQILIQQARTYLSLHGIEQEHAYGGARRPRVEEIDDAQLQAFLNHPLSLPFDIRKVATVELNQLRENIHKSIESQNDSRYLVMTMCPEMMAKLERWWTTWDKIHAGKLQKSTPTSLETSEPSSVSELLHNVLKSVMSMIMDHLEFILDSGSYRWQLKWAPTAFALKIARLQPELIDQSALLERERQIADLMKELPYPNFYRLIDLLITLPHVARFRDRIVTGGIWHGTQEQSLDRFKAIWCDQQKHDHVTGAYPSELAVQTPQQTFNQSSSGSQVEGSGLAHNDNDELLHNLLSGPQQITPTLNPQTTTIQAPSWMLTNSSIESYGLPEEGLASFFDFDLPLLMDPNVQNNNLG
ncbi:MAG: hypothetical protein M1834_002024 [Cirrosporium novae-zelandiae]|nr:MAG: hypothetical protein M1834_002024 [Cirrosporium novae-zelandiae]